jgi:hypothetical protein
MTEFDRKFFDRQGVRGGAKGSDCRRPKDERKMSNDKEQIPKRWTSEDFVVSRREKASRG